MNSPSTDKSPVLPTPEQRPARRLRWVCLVLAIVTAASGCWLAQLQLDQPLTGIDDANIFFTYASHLADGEGFVYNRGGERVEGFTSLLWTLICAFAFLVRAEPEPLLLGISTLLLATALYPPLKSLPCFSNFRFAVEMRSSISRVRRKVLIQTSTSRFCSFGI